MSTFKNDHRDHRAFRGWTDRTHCPVCSRSMALRPDGCLMFHKPPAPQSTWPGVKPRNEPDTGAPWCVASNTRPSAWYTDGE